MFQDKYFVPKSTDTYADVLTAWGLATVLSGVLFQAGVKKSNQVVVSERDTSFCVELPIALEEAWVNAAARDYLTFYLAKDANAAADKKHARAIDMNEQWGRVKGLKAWKEAGNDPKTDDPDLREQWLALQTHEYFNLFVGAQKLQADTPTNNVWDAFAEVEFPLLLKNVINYFSHPARVLEGKAQSSATLLNPGQTMGTNSLSAVGARSDKIAAPWPLEWLKTIGYYQAAFCVSFQGSDGKTTGISVAVLTPRRISLRNHDEIRSRFAAGFYATSSLKLECLAALNYALQFLNFAATVSDLDDLKARRVADAVSGFSFANFMAMGHVFKLKRITFLAMPLWIRIAADGDTTPMRDAVEEHVHVLRPLDDKRGETRSLLDAYLSWSSSGDLRYLWTFTALYGAYRMECVGSKKLEYQPTALSTTNLEIILNQQTSGNKPLAPVVSDPHFQAVARAIRKSTINALYQKDNLPSGIEVHYGLAQELRRLSPYKEKFVARLMQHLQTYNEENAKSSTRAINQNRTFRRANVTTQDIDRIVELIDDFGAETMCGLLLAYGYAKDVRDSDDDLSPSTAQNTPTNP